ncbi:MAG TPA: TrmH family RNA methyltransferase [Mycobacteriales bacterium]|nr:TrmH family RNA methyltransferase [Mycobacteriales bacterium]
MVVTDVDRAAALARELAPDIAEALLARAVVGQVSHPTGIAATASPPPYDDTALRTRTAPLVLLDHPRHGGNVGAVIRVSAAAGASGVAVIGGLDPWHPAVLRGSAGLHYALPVLQTAAEDVRGPLLILDAGGSPLDQVPDDAVLVVGSERAGVSEHLRSRADAAISLPMRAGVSSLNLATAAAAVLYQWRLHRRTER